MISLTASDQSAHGSRFLHAQNQVAIADEKVNRVLDCAEFSHWQRNPDGTRTAFFTLRKAIPGAAKGSVLSLSQIHEILFPAKR